jgi:hypothetical protein
LIPSKRTFSEFDDILDHDIDHDANQFSDFKRRKTMQNIFDDDDDDEHDQLIGGFEKLCWE